jgi:hypothetical protein
MCGSEDVALTVIDDEERVCAECLDTEFFYCEECREHWRCDSVESVELPDGRTVCEHCAEDIDDEDGDEEKFESLLHRLCEDERYNGRVFHARGVYFTLGVDEILEISNDVACTPRGGFPDLFFGPSAEEKACIEGMMEKIGFDEFFFDEMIEDCFGFDEEEALGYFEENDEDALDVYEEMRAWVNGGKTVFDSMDDFVNALRRIDLDEDVVYCEWEGDFIDLYENINETGEVRGTYEDASISEWIEVLENLDKHMVRSES